MSNKRHQSDINNQRHNTLSLLLMKREVTLLIIVFIIGCALSFLTDTFLTVTNIFNVIRQFSLLVIIAIGETFVLISGGIDLSVASTIGITSVICAKAAGAGFPTGLSVLFGLSCGAVVGLFNGLMISRVKINPFIITLGSMSISRGIALVITKAYSVPVPDKFILWLGQGTISTIPTPIVIMVVIVIISNVIYSKTIIGSHIKAIGGNEEAANVSGINIANNKMLVYFVSGILASLAGVVLTGRLNIGQPSAATGWEMDAVAAAIVGGTTLDGGEGSIIGTLMGAILLGLLGNAMVLLRVSMYWQQIVTGTIIIGVVTIDVLRKRK
jgi:ribose/xylose/arabinose/galactoside ABC-type transport system permease subunit